MNTVGLIVSFLRSRRFQYFDFLKSALSYISAVFSWNRKTEEFLTFSLYRNVSCHHLSHRTELECRTHVVGIIGVVKSITYSMYDVRVEENLDDDWRGVATKSLVQKPDYRRDLLQVYGMCHGHLLSLEHVCHVSHLRFSSKGSTKYKFNSS
jgi:hypothetical protein